MSLLSLAILLILIPVILTSVPYVTPSGMRTSPIFPFIPKIYEIDLDASYEDQWRTILADFKPILIPYIDSLGLSKRIPFEVIDLVDYPVVELYDQEFAEEMKAISSLLNISFTETILLNLNYDFTSGCTSILIQDDENNVYHARNFDFLDSNELSQMMFHGKYYKNGELLFEAIGLAAYSGLITGLKSNAYSFSINQYLDSKGVNVTLWDNIMIAVSDIAQAFKGKLSPALLAKRAFQATEHYDELIDYFKSADILSNAFFIVAGPEPGQGTVMTRYRNRVQNITTLDVNTGHWYVVQTNYVGNVEDPAFDNRATAARNWLDSIGRSTITKDLLLNQVLTVYPVFNNGTMYTTIMQPKTGYFNTSIWGWQKEN